MLKSRYGRLTAAAYLAGVALVAALCAFTTQASANALAPVTFKHDFLITNATQHTLEMDSARTISGDMWAAHVAPPVIIRPRETVFFEALSHNIVNAETQVVYFDADFPGTHRHDFELKTWTRLGAGLRSPFARTWGYSTDTNESNLQTTVTRFTRSVDSFDGVRKSELRVLVTEKS